MFFWYQKFSQITKTGFVQHKLRILIQIKTIGFCDLIQIQNPCFFEQRIFKIRFQSDGQKSIRLLLINWPSDLDYY